MTMTPDSQTPSPILPDELLSAIYREIQMLNATTMTILHLLGHIAPSITHESAEEVDKLWSGTLKHFFDENLRQRTTAGDAGGGS